jgi:hypothetical protein
VENFRSPILKRDDICRARHTKGVGVQAFETKRAVSYALASGPIRIVLETRIAISEPHIRRYVRARLDLVRIDNSKAGKLVNISPGNTGRNVV